MALTDEIFKGTAVFHKQFNKMCEPIMRYFGANAIAYVNINKHGELINLHTNREWMERCMEKHYYRDDSSMVCPENIDSGFVIGDQHLLSTDNNPMLKDCTTNYDMFFSGYNIEKTRDSYTLFTIDAPRANKKFLSRIMNERQIFKILLKNLQENIDSQSQQLESCKADFAKIKGELYYIQQGIINSTQQEQHQKIVILKDLGILSNNINTLNLSAQEKRCLRLYAENNTVKQVARHLKLSPETVTSYLNNVRNKFNCSYKSELTYIAGILEDLRML